MLVRHCSFCGLSYGIPKVENFDRFAVIRRLLHFDRRKKKIQPVSRKIKYTDKNFHQHSLNRGAHTSGFCQVNSEHLGQLNFQPRKLLVLSKTTRYAFEKERHPHLTETQLQTKLADRGSDYQSLLARHNAHTKTVQNLLDTLKQYENVETRLVEKKSDYTTDSIQWADLVLSAGGDGTFLLAASKIFGSKPLVGINTDFVGSEGYLCLPRKHSLDLKKMADKLFTDRVRWKKRQRIRVTVEGRYINTDPIDLHDEELSFPDHYQKHIVEEKHLRQKNGTMKRRVLPVRALNEVFFGESLSSRMSYYEIAIDEEPMQKQKSSGITVCTGTGSTSWYWSQIVENVQDTLKRSFNINKLSYQSVEEILRIANKKTGANYPTNREAVKSVADAFNGYLLFDPRVQKMVYTVRDPVGWGKYIVNNPRGYASRIKIRSRCFDACLTIDAGSSFVFNDGAIATLEIHDEDALNTIELID